MEYIILLQSPMLAAATAACLASMPAVLTMPSDRVKPSSNGSLSSSASFTCQRKNFAICRKVHHSRIRLTEHDLHPLRHGGRQGAIVEDGKVQGRLDEAEIGTVRGQVELWVLLRRSFQSVGPCACCCLDVDGILSEVGGHGPPNGRIKAVVVAEVDVCAAETAIVFNDYIRGCLSAVQIVEDRGSEDLGRTAMCAEIIQVEG